MIKPVFYIIILFSLIAFPSQAQNNLVPNGSFEEYNCCPQQTGDFYCVKNWFNPTSTTPDYYNTCSSNSNVSIPINLYGQQYAEDGNAYIGIVLNTIDGYREYIAVELIKSMKSGAKYYFQFFVSTSDSSYNPSNNIGILFISDINDLELDTTMMSGTPIIINTISNFNSSIISDTNKWKMLSGEYTASGCEKFLIIGNFISQENTEFTYDDLIESYYYIDGISLIGINENNEIPFPNVFTPNNDGINDSISFNNYSIVSIKILNRWGEIIYYSDSEINWDGKYKGELCPDGTYFYIYRYKNCNNDIEEKTGFIQLIR